MEKLSSQDELTVMHQFDRLCQLALDGEAADYFRHLEYRANYEVNFSDMTEQELDSIFIIWTIPIFRFSAMTLKLRILCLLKRCRL